MRALIFPLKIKFGDVYSMNVVFTDRMSWVSVFTFHIIGFTDRMSWVYFCSIKFTIVPGISFITFTLHVTFSAHVYKVWSLFQLRSWSEIQYVHPFNRQSRSLTKGSQSRWADHEITGENIPMGHFINTFIVFDSFFLQCRVFILSYSYCSQPILIIIILIKFIYIAPAHKSIYLL